MEIKSSNARTIRLTKEVSISERDFSDYTDPNVPVKYRVYHLQYDMLRYNHFDLDMIEALKLIRELEK